LPLFGKGVSGWVAALREEAEAIVVEVRGLSETIPYELDEHVERDMERSEAIQSAISSAGSLLLHVAAQSPLRTDGHAQLPSPDGTLPEEIAEGVRRISVMLEQGEHKGADLVASPPEIRIEEGRPVMPESLQEAIEAYSMLRKQCMAILAVPAD